MNMVKPRILIATALFDGHDVSINIFRRLMVQRGAEVIHLGHNRSVNEIALAAIEEDVSIILISSYQGGHNEYLSYLLERLEAYQASHIQVFAGGGGTIQPGEIDHLEQLGVQKIYHANDGQALGIEGIADDIIKRFNANRPAPSTAIEITQIENDPQGLSILCKKEIAQNLSAIDLYPQQEWPTPLANSSSPRPIIIGVTGTGGAGKSSLVDEIIGNFLLLASEIKIAVIAIDPSRRKSGGALLGDRIRMNHINNERVYFRSFSTRGSVTELSQSTQPALNLLSHYPFDLIIVETSGIGQGNSQIVDICDYSLYVMTRDFGAAMQLDKIDMLDLADLVVINKFEKSGSEDALRDILLYTVRNKGIKVPAGQTIYDMDLPVYGTSAQMFNDPGVSRLAVHMLNHLKNVLFAGFNIDAQLMQYKLTRQDSPHVGKPIRPTYLADIVDTVERYHQNAEIAMLAAENSFCLQRAIDLLALTPGANPTKTQLQQEFDLQWNRIEKPAQRFIQNFQQIKALYTQDHYTYQVRQKTIEVATQHQSLSGTQVPKIALPDFSSWRDQLKFYYQENLPGAFPFTAGVFPFKRTTEDPKRMFAGEGGPARTNKRFHYLCENENAKRLSVAFDGITLYGEDPSESPDIYGKIGESGVSICTIDDMDLLLDGFDLTDPLTSVSMTINGPAPIILAMFFVTAYKRTKTQEENKLKRALAPEEDNQLKLKTFQSLRGTVQADILKEDQAQNTCIFNLQFALRLIGDVQTYFSQNAIKNFYSISISGYHIAEAGANPITQLALTLSNGFHYVEHFLSRNIPIDDFASNLSFFFSNGMEPEYAVLGRVARRIWSIALRDKYQAQEKGQQLKYHIQTSGRSLHALEVEFNDIRTTLQALFAFYDNCNSLHTNAYDEAITTPTEESVRRSMAIQLILTKEYGLLKNENPNQGSYIIEQLTNLVEQAILDEFKKIADRGGVLGAMETGYQRAKIQEDSIFYESKKHDGRYPIVGVNTFLNPQTEHLGQPPITRATPAEKDNQLARLKTFHQKNQAQAGAALGSLQQAILRGDNVFAELLNTVQYCSLGQITHTLYDVGGRYRRSI